MLTFPGIDAHLGSESALSLDRNTQTFWLFPGWHGHLTTRSAQRIYRDALVHAGIDRGHGFHTLRHCFGTHLFEAGVDLRTIQALMGHASVITTTRYVQVSRTILEGTRSPMDLLAVAEANTIV